jgi:integrase
MSNSHHLGDRPPSSVGLRFTQGELADARHFLTTSAFTVSTASAYTNAVIRFRSYCPHRNQHASVVQLDQCVTIAIARTMASNGHYSCAIATLVAFDGLLRVGELVTIGVVDVSLPGDIRRGIASEVASPSRPVRRSTSLHPSLRQSSSAFIRLAVTKTGSNQTAEITNADVIALLVRHIQRQPTDGPLFALPGASPADHFRSVFRAACVALDLHRFGFTPHSLRHGGATHAHMHLGQTIEHVLHRGRWQSNSSARIYLQSGAAALIAIQLSEQAREWVHRLQSDWVTHLSSDCFDRQFERL